ncbi:MAG: hypothetical protein U0892_07335 [Pirellulales bacterium]
MSRLNWFQRFYWQRLAKPATERELFRLLMARPVASVMEIGIGSGERMKRVAQLIQLPAGTEQLRYVGVDSFESSEDGRAHLTLKQAHQQASQLGFRAVLIPGDIKSAVQRAAHKSGAMDLIIIDGHLDPAAVTAGPVAPWLGHITHASSIIMACSQVGGPLVQVPVPASSTGRMAA